MRIRELFVVGSGGLTLSAILAVIYATAFMGGGHPPASGIVNGLILLCVTPFSLVASVIGAITWQDAAEKFSGNGKFFFVSTGVCVAFTMAVGALILVKFGFGRAI